MQKITPFLWYSKEAQEAAAFYASIFPIRASFASRRCRANRPAARPAR